MSKKPTVLMILDGYGLNSKESGNAVAQAKTPVMDKLMAECPFVKGNASGMAVGLPDGQMGNSEVGHLNMGAGRIVYQELTRITKEIQDGTFFENPALLDAVNNCKANDSALHMFGLLSDGGVHSHNTHLYGLLELAKRNGLSKVYVHCFLDGRDTPPASGKGFAEDLEAEMAKIGVGKIASVMGRYYAMDRDNNYDRVKIAYDALTKGEGNKGTSGPAAIQASYDNDKTDEFVIPTVIEENGAPVATIKDKDSVIFFNFRPDRAREITRAFCDDDFKGFGRVRKDITFVAFSDYDPTIPNKDVAFHKVSVTNTNPDDPAAYEVVGEAKPTQQEIDDQIPYWGDHEAEATSVYDLSKWCENNTTGKIWVMMADADPSNGWGGYIYNDTPVTFWSSTTEAPEVTTEPEEEITEEPTPLDPAPETTEPEEEITDPEIPLDPNPKTGDASVILVIAAVASIALAALYIKRRQVIED